MTESNPIKPLPIQPEPVESSNMVKTVEPEDGADDTEPPTLIRSLVENRDDDMPTAVLPMHLVDLQSAALTDVGRQRQSNEDDFGIKLLIDRQISPRETQVKVKGLYILCDGMGGHAGGEVASRMAVETVQEELRWSWCEDQTWALPDKETIVAAIHAANTKIYRENLESARLGNARMGTTLVLILVCDNQVAVAHVGDSRVYRFNRKHGLTQLTTDHEVGQREIQKGVSPQDAYARYDAYQLTQALGPRDNQLVDPGVTFLDVMEDTLFILASDGLTDNDLLEQYWPEILEPMLKGKINLEQGTQQLIDLANQYNGHDNITTIAVRMWVRPEIVQTAS